MFKSTETRISVRTCNEKFKHTVPLRGGPQFTNPHILSPYTEGQIFQELKFPHLRPTILQTRTVSIHFPIHVTTLRSANAHILLAFQLFLVGRNYPAKGHSLYVAFFLHQRTTDNEVPCTVYYRNVRCVSFWTHFTFTSF